MMQFKDFLKLMPEGTFFYAENTLAKKFAQLV